MIIGEIRKSPLGAAVTVTTSATKVVSRSTKRFEVLVQNTHASSTLTVGSSLVLAAGKGIVLAPGDVYRHMGSGELYAKASTGTVTANVVTVPGPSNTNDMLKETQVTVGSAATQILAKDLTRVHATVENSDSTTRVTIANDKGVTDGVGGIILAPGKQIDLYGGQELWAIGPTGPVVVNVVSDSRR